MTFITSWAVANSSGWIESSNVIVTNWGTSEAFIPFGGDNDGQRQFGSLHVLGSQEAAVVAAWLNWFVIERTANIAVLIPKNFMFEWIRKKVKKEKEKKSSMMLQLFFSKQIYI